MPFEIFDRGRLQLEPLERRKHDLDRSCLIHPSDKRESFTHPALEPLAECDFCIHPNFHGARINRGNCCASNAIVALYHFLSR